MSAVLAGVRPKEITEWRGGPVEPVTATSFAASPDAQAGAIERAVETAKRIAARGGDAVVLIDRLDDAAPGAARRTMAAARDIVDGGSLTSIATASDKPVGGETTVIALDERLTSTGRFPAVDLAARAAPAARSCSSATRGPTRSPGARGRGRPRRTHHGRGRRSPRSAPRVQRGVYATRPQEGSGASSIGSPSRSGWM